MKVVHLSTTLSGGAGQAAIRTVNALNSCGIDASLLSRTDSLGLISQRNPSKEKLLTAASSMITGAQRYLLQNSNELVTTVGIDLFKHSRELSKILQSSDLIHLHASYNFFNLHELHRLIGEKPLAITLHDQRFLTGGCHYSTFCDGFRSNCSNCPKVRKMARGVVKENKKKITNVISFLSKEKLSLICPSKWMQERVYETPLFMDLKNSVVHNCLPNSFFAKAKTKVRENHPRRIGIVATQITNPYKGWEFFIEGICELKNQTTEELEIVVITHEKFSPRLIDSLKFDVVSAKTELELKLILETIDVLCVPSMIDNSPNVVLEALARNVVVAASDSGGTGEIPQKLGLKTFRFGDVRNFVSVLSQCLANPRLTKSQSNLLESLISETTHATQLIKIYESII